MTVKTILSRKGRAVVTIEPVQLWKSRSQHWQSTG